MNYICFWGILASITGIAIMFSVIKHKKSVSAVKYGTYLIFSILIVYTNLKVYHFLIKKCTTSNRLQRYA